MIRSHPSRTSPKPEIGSVFNAYVRRRPTDFAWTTSGDTITGRVNWDLAQALANGKDEQ